MSLNDQDISRIANLARLELQPEEQARMLSKICLLYTSDAADE